MPDTLRDLWPDDIELTDVLTPLAILRFQASRLSQRTKRVLEAEVVTVSHPKWTIHHFEIIAPVLDRYRFRLFSVSHQPDMVYPAIVGVPDVESDDRFNVEDIHTPSQESFEKEIEQLLNSPRTRSIVQSLIARSNELQVNEHSTIETAK